MFWNKYRFTGSRKEMERSLWYPLPILSSWASCVTSATAKLGNDIGKCTQLIQMLPVIHALVCVCSFLSRPTESRYRTIPSPQAPSCYSSQLHLLHCPSPNSGGHSSVLFPQNSILGVTWVEPYSLWNFLRLSSFTQYNVPEVNPSCRISFYLLSNSPCYGWTIVWITYTPQGHWGVPSYEL